MKHISEPVETKRMLPKGKQIFHCALTIYGKSLPQPVEASSRIFFFFLFVAIPVAYGSSPGKGSIWSYSYDLRYSHGKIGSKQHLQSALQLVAMLDP